MIVDETGTQAALLNMKGAPLDMACAPNRLKVESAPRYLAAVRDWWPVAGRGLGSRLMRTDSQYQQAKDERVAQMEAQVHAKKWRAWRACSRKRAVFGSSARKKKVAISYIHTDHQSSVIAITDSAGNPISRRNYGVYGETDSAQMTGANGATSSLRPFCGFESAPSTFNLLRKPPTKPFGYTGRRYDADTGLYYYRARWYDPELGTFLETDPIGELDYINMYAYVGGNPLNATDPSGMECTNSERSGSTHCYKEGAYDVTFPTPRGFQNTRPSDDDYHQYNTRSVPSLQNESGTRNWVREHPTPALLQRAASPNGTVNDATPAIGGLIPIHRISPVESFTAINRVSGNEVVVNVTLPGHPLGNGVVIRDTVTSAAGNVIINNFGEGNGRLQAPGSREASTLNGVWYRHVPPPGPAASMRLHEAFCQQHLAAC